ncbi:MAG: DUF58 domain-containing protein [Ruminococcaceae bacterium]|nr:DUF58 domain-containing protein [Oscillospiraceae bacterium]
MAEKNQKKRPPALTLQRGAVLYFILYCYGLLMTQLLRSSVSAVFFWFMIIAAPLSFLIMLLGKAAIQVYVMTDKNQTEKLSPVEYEIRVINASPLPYPFVEVIMSKPREDGVRTLKENLLLSLVPLGGYSVKNTVVFRYRGLYEIGVHEIYISDPLRLFRLRMDVNNFSNVTVYPRKLEFERDSESAVSDVPSPFVRVLDSRDKSEVSNIREYRMGDSLKSIHWKLSSKSEELQVKDYNTNNDRHTYIFVDLAAPTPCPEVEREKARKQLKKLTKKKAPDGEEEKKLSLKEKIGLSLASAKENKRAHKYRRRRRRGNTAKDIETIDMIDALILETSGKAKKNKKKPDIDDLFVPEDKLSSEEMIARLSNIVGDSKSATRDELLEARRAWGGIVKDEFEDELPEYCADGVVEIAVATMNSELRRGNNCTVVWYDRRSDKDIYCINLSDVAEFDDTYLKFASAAVVPCEKSISELTNIIGEAINVTVKIVTANIDPSSVAQYCAIPAMFGGAGTGCVTEVVLFNPTDKYVSTTERLEYTESQRLRLRHNGISLTDVKETVRSDGGTVLVCADRI